MAVVSFYVAGLLTALLWGGSPILSKRGLSHGGNPLVLAIVALGTGLAMFWAGLAVLHGPAHVLPRLSLRGYAIFLTAGLVGSALGRAASYTGIDLVGASVNMAVVATYPIFATVLAYLLLGELVTATQVAGVVVVVAGLVLLTLSKGGDRTGWTTRDLLVPLLGAAVYGTGSVLRRYGLTTTPATALDGVAIESAAAVAALLAYALLANRRALLENSRRSYAYFLGTGVLSSLGLLSLFVGLASGPVAIVVTLAGTSTLLTTAFSWALLGDLERVTRGVVVAAVLVVSGVALIALS